MRMSATMLVLITTILSAASVCQATEKASAPVIELSDTIHRFERVNEGDVVTHDFKVFNRGDAVLEIKQVEPG